jgi:nitroreductase
MNGPDYLEWLQQRRSVRAFAERPVPREVLERLLAAATSAPSNTNRQPWRYAVVTGAATRRRIAEMVRGRAEEMKAVIRRGHHADDFGSYGDFFHEPLQSAAVIVIPQYRDYPDLIGNLLASGGGDPEQYLTAADMQAELCSTAASVMNLLLQAQAEGLGACWMAGPTIARDLIEQHLGIAQPFHMMGAVALGYPAEAPTPKGRKPLERVAQWFEE